ncbi:MAG: acyloxyacyl hydrolase [Flavobacteriaceae bacterium]
MNALKICIFTALIFYLSADNLVAQYAPSIRESKTRLGFVYGYGSQENLGMNADYQYDVIYFQAQYFRQLANWRNTGLELLLQPQYNSANFIYGDNDFRDINGYEIGLNIGFLLRHYPANKMLSLYFLISTGPHYASILPYRQSSGFIFSDNLFVGLTIKLTDDSYLDIRPGIRHLSNAGFKYPNGGINNLIISAGLMVALK